MPTRPGHSQQDCTYLATKLLHQLLAGQALCDRLQELERSLLNRPAAVRMESLHDACENAKVLQHGDITRTACSLHVDTKTKCTSTPVRDLVLRSLDTTVVTVPMPMAILARLFHKVPIFRVRVRMF